MWAVVKKELKSYFYTPIGYICIGAFLLIFSITFFYTVIFSGSVNIEYMYETWPVLIAVAAIIPLLTMRTFSEERKTGTEQLLLTSPISLTKVVIGKFIAALLVILIIEACTIVYFAITCYYGMPNLLIVFSTLLGFILFVMSYISFGMLTSSITESQIVSAILSIGFFILTWLAPNISTKLQSYSFMNMFYKYTEGQINIADTVTFITFTIMCLLLTTVVMQRRKLTK